MHEFGCMIKVYEIIIKFVKAIVTRRQNIISESKQLQEYKPKTTTAK